MMSNPEFPQTRNAEMSDIKSDVIARYERTSVVTLLTGLILLSEERQTERNPAVESREGENEARAKWD